MSEDPYADDIRARMAADMTTTLASAGCDVALIEEVLDGLVEDGMHQVYKAWDEGRP